MRKRSAAIMRHLASESCSEIIECLKEGLDHPDDLAKKLKVVRQSVDWHLLKLTAFGIVERSAVSSATSRPRITYKLTPTGRDLIDRLDGTIDQHFSGIGQKFESLQQELDHHLARGEISEEVYKERTRRLKREMDFLKGEC